MLSKNTSLNEEEGEESYMDVPRLGKKWERKPYPTPMKLLIRRAKEERQARQENPCRVLEQAPENGLLVPELIDVAYQVNHDRTTLLHGLSKLIHCDPVIPIHRCRFCPELHIGQHAHEIRTCEGPGSGTRNSYHVWRRGGVKDVLGFEHCYHLFDRVGKPRVGHKERLQVPRLPAIIELCIQAGLNLDDYPTKRRTAPVYSIEGRIVDFEMHKYVDSSTDHLPLPVISSPSISEDEESLNLNEMATKTLRSWLDMRVGVMKIMKRYNVVTCGYCPEVQVGPKGHKVRMCRAAKHQVRNGQHAWQEATVDDLIRPNFVWHVRKPDGSPLTNALKRYYGKSPAVVELCLQAGAPIPKECKSMLRLDVVLPDLDEYDLVS
ncbi:hypothetical protein KSP39_PZI003258 [Platanthera zijinensis]|uniref:APO domain-containing protein n=1 Tax=Platanthera zijinensis TaxID=2320716 RepID=A0AAP0BUK4_9ASPA